MSWNPTNEYEPRANEFRNRFSDEKAKVSSIPTDEDEQRANEFLHRISQIPLVKAFYQNVASTYETRRNADGFIGANLRAAEGYVKYANEQAEPLKKLIYRPVATASTIADQQLAKIQNRFPVINTTPDELVAYGQNLYEKSGAKPLVDFTAAVTINSVEIVKGAVVSSRDLAVGLARDGAAAVDYFVSGGLDFTESTVDKYVSSPDSKKRPSAPREDASYVQRVQCISYKAVGGVKYRVGTTYNSVKGFASRRVDAAGRLVRDISDATGSFIQHSIADINRIRDAVLIAIVNRSKEISAKSDLAAVYITQSLTDGMANVSDRVFSTAIPYLPEEMEKPAVKFITYTHHWQERVQKANSTSDIWKAASDETKKSVHVAREFIQSILNNRDAHVKDNKRW